MWLVEVGGSPQACYRWPTRKYKYKRNARRRIKRIREARDIGVSTIWLLKVEAIANG